MRNLVSKSLVLCFLLTKVLAIEGGRQSGPAPSTPALGRLEPGAATLTGYLIQKTPFVPLKKFALDAGFTSSVSPSRRGVAIIVGRKIFSVLDRRLAVIDGKEFPLSVEAVERDGDFFVPLEFYEKAFPNSVRFDAKTRRISISLPGKTLTIPIKRPPPEHGTTPSPAPLRKQP